MNNYIKAALISIGIFMVMGIAISKILELAILENSEWKVQVVQNYINIRSSHDANTDLLGRVLSGEYYEVLNIYEDDEKYIWYEIKTLNNTGWISSDRNSPSVIELNGQTIEA